MELQSGVGMHLPEIASRETFKEKSKRHFMVIEVVKKSPYVRKGSKRAPAWLKRDPPPPPPPITLPIIEPLTNLGSGLNRSPSIMIKAENGAILPYLLDHDSCVDRPYQTASFSGAKSNELETPGTT